MKHKVNLIGYIVLGLFTGLSLGYVLFGKKEEAPVSSGKVDTSSTAAAIEYTCSMHPQIRQMEPGVCPLCEMDLTPVENGASDQAIVLKMSAEAIKLADIQTTRIQAGSLGEKRIRLSGKIMADERRAASQSAHIAGRIERLYVTYIGEKVRVGQPLVELYAPALVNGQRELLEALRMKSTNPGLLDAARNKLRSWKMPESFIRELEQTGKVQREVLIRADRSGVVMARKVSVGDYIEEGTPLFELMDLSKVWVFLEAYESDLPSIRLGSPVEITTPAAPGRTFTARITFIDPVLNAESRTVALRAELDNGSGLLKPEMFVNGEVLVGETEKGGLIIPKTAVLWTGKRSVVYVRVPNSTVPSFEFREVELGARTAEGIQILAGLEAGEEVVTQGAFAIDAAAQLNNQSSMMNRRVEAEGAAKLEIPNLKGAMDPKFLSAWGEILHAYLQLKDALVDTQPEKASQRAVAFLDALSKASVNQSDPTLQSWWLKYLGGLKAHTRKIIQSNGIAAQRQQFLFVSEWMIQHVQAFGKADERLFIQHCPMAFNNQGGDWISNEQEVLNPYFGSEMLRCGVVKDSFP